MIENITNIANELMQSARFPLLAALLLGLLVAFNPCQLAINISALTYLHKNGRGRKANTLMGIAYVLGRMTTYTVMGWILIFVIRQSNSIAAFKNLLSKAEDFLPYVLGGIGAFLIIKAFMPHHHHGDNCHNSGLCGAVDIGGKVTDFHVNSIVRMMHIHFHSGVCFRQQAADVLGKLDGCQGESLVGALGFHLEGLCTVQIVAQIILNSIEDGI